MLMMTPDDRATDWEELPLIMGINDLAVLLGVSRRTIRRWHQLGEIPEATNRTWSRHEIRAWIEAGRPERDVWDRIKSKK